MKVSYSQAEDSKYLVIVDGVEIGESDEAPLKLPELQKLIDEAAEEDVSFTPEISEELKAEILAEIEQQDILSKDELKADFEAKLSKYAAGQDEIEKLKKDIGKIHKKLNKLVKAS